MSGTPLVSIIVPAYNAQKYIRRCINSISAQSYKNIEIIVINDGSTDGTKAIIKVLKEKESRIVLINERNRGVSFARNQGITSAKGKYIVFIDADDEITSDCIEYMESLIDKNGSDFAFSTSHYINKINEREEKPLIEKIITKDQSIAALLSPKVTVGCWNKIYRKDFLVKKSILFNENLFYGEGLNFIIDVSLKADSVTMTNKKTYVYRRNNKESATTHYDIEKYRNGEKSLLGIRDKINMKDKAIYRSFYVHLSTFYLGAMSKSIQHKNSFTEWKNKYKKASKKALICKEIGAYRRLLLTAGLISPHFVSFLDRQKTSRRIRHAK